MFSSKKKKKLSNNCLSQRLIFDLLAIESRIDYLSNQKKVNPILFEDEGTAHIGWLQSSDAHEREEAVRLLLENKDGIAMIKNVEDIKTLQDLNLMRLHVKSSHEEILKMIKDNNKSNMKMTFVQFSKCLQDCMKILQKEFEIKKLKDDFKNQFKVDESNKPQKQGGKK